MAYRVIHYINQFFGGIGGEEKADHPIEVRDGVVGPGMAFNKAFNGEAEVVATVICGDNYCVAHQDEVAEFIAKEIKERKIDALVGGPAFNAGRYGMSSGGVCAAIAEKCEIPTVGGMYIENPGIELYKARTYLVETKDSAAGMKDAVPAMASLLLKLLKGEKPVPGADYIERGVRINKFYEEVGAERAVSMLIKKIKGEAFETEYKMPVFDRVTPRPGIKDLAHATIALVTSGGIVPEGNPDHIAASSARNYGEYDIDGVKDLIAGKYQTAHGGYDQTYANEDPDRVLPVDVLREMESQGKIGKLYKYFYTTVGNGTAVGNAKKWGEEIGHKLKEDNVQAVILTST